MWRDPEADRRQVRTSTVLGRAGQPDEVAQCRLMFAADGFATAKVLVVDGRAADHRASSRYR